MVEQVTQPQLRAAGWLRWMWRQLTSMRTALFLLLLLAVAALPGSIWPQRSIDAARTADYIASHPTAGPWLDRLGFFEVYASPWFAAIYLLLFISLVGCVLPRSRMHWRAMRATPPRAPARLERLSAHRVAEVAVEPGAVLEAAREVLARKRFRTHAHDLDSLSAEKGFLKETGNLVFHVALIFVIVGVAIGHLFGWKGDVIVPVGQTFANTLLRYDTFAPGPWVDPQTLAPFTLRVDRLDATFEENVTGRGQFGQPRDFTAHVTTTATPGAASQRSTIKVNHPLEMQGAGVFLLGNGYAPVVTVRDARGNEVYSGPTPFLARDNNYTSVGAIKVPGAAGKQLGFSGLFLPTALVDREQGPISVFPDAKKPALALTLFEGQLFPGGRPQSVYVLDTAEMTQVKNDKGEPLRLWLEPGKTITLPGDRGSITFDGVDRFAGLSIRHDPGKLVTLAAALLALAGLVASLVVRRRRVFLRVSPAGPAGRTVVTVAGMAKGDDEGLDRVVQDVLTAVQDRMPRPPETDPDPAPSRLGAGSRWSDRG
ncbi:cytochrome c biogenesis protein ResB [Pedococcus sp. 5OH_020]|uniref:cytochrome c biogenesis protein ResB n=1 Tax=Pedococcus sp. 5OH_020 TaxID=2989814 RepID=UPI0022E9D17F|nr:cytochrome c biogenesis protein ResB [Pedococcus sp. 5OH_020]